MDNKYILQTLEKTVTEQKRTEHIYTHLMKIDVIRLDLC